MREKPSLRLMRALGSSGDVETSSALSVVWTLGLSSSAWSASMFALCGSVGRASASVTLSDASVVSASEAEVLSLRALSVTMALSSGSETSSL